jgi:hypothetical protein
VPSTMKEASKESAGKREEEDDDAFAGSFADWRDRKKEKAMTKGPGSIKK